MQNNKPTLAQKFMPFLMLGLMVVLFIIGIFVFSYILIVGAIIGLILFVITAIRNKFSKHKQTHTMHQFEVDIKQQSRQQQGRTIEYDEDNNEPKN